MRALALLSLLGLLFSPLGHACRHGHRRTARAAGPSQFHMPVGRPGSIRNAPIAWMYLPEDPVPTGSAPDVVVGMMPPCNTRPVYGTVQGDANHALTVHVHVQSRGGAGDGGCAPSDPFVDLISLSRVRLGTVTVTDSMPHEASDGPAPLLTLHVVPDDATLPPVMLRRVRGCTPGDDATCTAGGVCASLADRARGVCVPPVDPELVAQHRCEEGRVDVAVAHRGAMPAGPAPADPASLHACLIACDDAHPCTDPLACIEVGGAHVCAP